MGNANFNFFDMIKGTGIDGPFVPLTVKLGYSEYNIQLTTGSGIQDINIVLPVRINEQMNETLNYTISRRGIPAYQAGLAFTRNRTGQAIKDALGAIAPTLQGRAGVSAENLAKSFWGWAQFNYENNASKQITIPFNIFLPRGRQGLEEDREKIKQGISILQGLCYPVDVAQSHPPLMDIYIGSLYEAFPAFLTGVQVVWEKDWQSTGSGMMDTGAFPLMVSGRLTFTNIFLYTWSDVPTTVGYATSLKENPKVLFNGKAGTIGDSSNVWTEEKENVVPPNNMGPPNVQGGPPVMGPGAAITLPTTPQTRSFKNQSETGRS